MSKERIRHYTHITSIAILVSCAVTAAFIAIAAFGYYGIDFLITHLTIPQIFIGASCGVGIFGFIAWLTRQ